MNTKIDVFFFWQQETAFNGFKFEADALYVDDISII